MIHNLHHSGFSDVGLVRKNNQDCFDVSPELGLVVVADGMGGHKGGEVASSVAVKGMIESLSLQQWDDSHDEMQMLLNIGASVEFANNKIREEAARRPELAGMGTTIVVAMFRLGRAFIAHVGDSRIYRFRDGKLEQLTRDHSLIQKLLDNGTFVSIEEAEAAGIGSNVLTRGLGIEDQVDVDVADVVLEAGDLFLFCTDGLTNMLTDKDIEKSLNHYRNDLDAAGERLILAALSAGGTDNVTLVLAEAELA